MALLVPTGDIAGVVIAVAHHLGSAVGVVAILHPQPERPRVEAQTDLALVRRSAGDRVQQGNGEPGQWPTHRAEPHLLSRGVRDLHRGLGLAEPVPDGDSPGASYLLDDLRVQRLAGPDDLLWRGAHGTEVGLDQHPPHGRWGAEAGHPTPL